MPMEHLIRQIVDMDAQARKITDAAQQEKLHAEEEIAAQTAELEKSYLKQSRRRLEMMNESERTILEQRWKRRREQYDEQKKKIERVFAENRDVWIDDAVAAVLAEENNG